MTNREIDSMIETGLHSGYNDANKSKFRSLAMRLLRDVNKILGINADVRFNPGGVAVSGEATLHGHDIYIQISGDSAMAAVLVRTCESKTDYIGGPNMWYSFDRLREHGAKGLAQYAGQLCDREGQNQ